MYGKVLIFLISAAVAKGENKECNCEELKNCLTTEMEVFSSCHTKCTTSSKIPAKVQTCFDDAQKEFENVAKETAACFFSPQHGFCAATPTGEPSTVNPIQGPARKRRAGGQMGNMVLPFNLPKGEAVETGARAANPFEQLEELKPYFSCMKTCANLTGPEEENKKWSNGHPGHGNDLKFFEHIEKCGKGCTINPQTAMKAFKTCRPQMGDEAHPTGAPHAMSESREPNVLEGLCVCIHDALNKSKTSCNKPPLGPWKPKKSKCSKRKQGHWVCGECKWREPIDHDDRGDHDDHKDHEEDDDHKNDWKDRNDGEKDRNDGEKDRNDGEKDRNDGEKNRNDGEKDRNDGEKNRNDGEKDRNDGEKNRNDGEKNQKKRGK